jgi:hypothetical protein
VQRQRDGEAKGFTKQQAGTVAPETKAASLVAQLTNI